MHINKRPLQVQWSESGLSGTVTDFDGMPLFSFGLVDGSPDDIEVMLAADSQFNGKTEKTSIPHSILHFLEQLPRTENYQNILSDLMVELALAREYRELGFRLERLRMKGQGGVIQIANHTLQIAPAPRKLNNPRFN